LFTAERKREQIIYILWNPLFPLKNIILKYSRKIMYNEVIMKSNIRLINTQMNAEILREYKRKYKTNYEITLYQG